MNIVFKAAEVDLPEGPICTLEELSEATRIVEKEYPKLAEMLPSSHPWRSWSNEHRQLTESILAGALTELDFGSEDPDRLFICFLAQVHDLGRVPDGLRPVPERFRDLSGHGQYSVRILNDWGVLEVFSNDLAKEVIVYTLEHHSDPTSSLLQGNSAFDIWAYTATCLVRDADKLCSFKVKANRRLNDPDEIRFQKTLMKRAVQNFDDDANYLTEGAQARFDAHRISLVEECYTYPDFMLSQLSWLFDFNHPVFERAAVLGGGVALYIDWFRRTLPEKQYIGIVDSLCAYIATIWN